MSNYESNVSKWMIFIRIITILGIPVGGWIVKTIMNTDKNVAVIMTEIHDMKSRVGNLERKNETTENRYIDDLRRIR